MIDSRARILSSSFLLLSFLLLLQGPVLVFGQNDTDLVPVTPIPRPLVAPVPIPLPVPRPSVAPVRLWPTHPHQMQTGPLLISMILLDAGRNDVDIAPLNQSVAVVLADVGGSINVRIDPVAPPGVASVVYQYNGGFSNFTDNTAPYTMAGDGAWSTNRNVWVPVGQGHPIVATAYSGPNGTGNKLGSVFAAFNVIHPPTPAPVPVPRSPIMPVPVSAPIPKFRLPTIKPVVNTRPVLSFILVNADTGADVFPLTHGKHIYLSQVGSRRINVRFESTIWTNITSVGFTLDGHPTRTENVAPYALQGDDGRGKYYGWTPDTGYMYELGATAYSGKNLAGSPVAWHSIEFYVHA